MKVYVKKDKALKLLGEGKVYSKKDLVLKEGNTNNPLIGDATPNDEKVNGVSGLETVANQQLSSHPAEDGVSVGLDSLTNSGQKLKGDGVSLTMTQDELKGNKPQLSSIAQQMPGAEVRIMRNQPTMQVSSVAPKKVMDEMRENSVPFTKEEMTEFLKSL